MLLYQIYFIIRVIYICWFDVRIPEDDLKNIETYRSVSEFYVKVYILILVMNL